VQFKGFFILAGVCGIVLAWGSRISAFPGDYKSLTGNDMAFIISYNSTDITYHIKDVEGDDEDLEVEHQVISAGICKTINSKLKLYGAFNFFIDGELSVSDLNLRTEDIESKQGYFLTGEIGYTFLDQSKFSVSGFARIDYLFEDEWKINEVILTIEDYELVVAEDILIAIEGYEVIAGVMGKYDITPHFSIFATGRGIPFSDLTFEIERVVEFDLERKDIFGLQAGGVFDKDKWFVKGQYDFGMESGFGVSGGIKF
jgi:hypothetical protein